MHAPLISVIIPTFNRAELLRASLMSLADQKTLAADHFEVLVIDDGSTDSTRNVCQSFENRLRIEYVRIEHSGIAAAKNLGIFMAHAPILLFFDDDDVADAGLLEKHLQVHNHNPAKNIAVLGYTDWAPWITVTPVMNFVLNVGQMLFAYRNLTHGKVLDYTYFWGGRSSCKRSLLATHGIHNQDMLNMQDVELGYRLSRFGLKVVYSREAVQFMNRPLTYLEFCRRCERQGRSRFLLSQLHPDATIQKYCQIQMAERQWRESAKHLNQWVREVQVLETSVDLCSNDNLVVQRLNQLYSWSFKAFRAKGVVDAMQGNPAAESASGLVFS